MKSSFSFFIVLIFASFMMLTSCGKSNNTPTSEKEVPDSLLTDSIPPSGESEFQQDAVPQGKIDPRDTIGDTLDRK